jgi:hypothetical protein
MDASTDRALALRVTLIYTRADYAQVLRDLLAPLGLAVVQGPYADAIVPRPATVPPLTPLFTPPKPPTDTIPARASQAAHTAKAKQAPIAAPPPIVPSQDQGDQQATRLDSKKRLDKALIRGDYVASEEALP